MGDINKLTLPITILIASVILGGFYYASESNKQKSIERQQEMKIAEESRIEEMKIAEDRRLEEKTDNIKSAEAQIRSNCVTMAVKNAEDLYRDYCNSNSFCHYEEGAYLTPQYNNAYATCLQSYGLQ